MVRPLQTPPAVEHVPTVDHVEHNAELVTRELARLVEHARDRLRMLQDVDAELAAVDDYDRVAGNALLRRHKLAYELRVICRQLTRAQAALINAADPRAPLVGVQLGWLAQAEQDDRPWKLAA